MYTIGSPPKPPLTEKKGRSPESGSDQQTWFIIANCRAKSHLRFARATLMIILDTSQLTANLLGAALLKV